MSAHRSIFVQLLAILLVAGLGAAPGLAQDPPVNISLVGQFDQASNYADVWGDGNFAYLARFGFNQVTIVDISNPANPVLAANYNTGVGGASAQDVKVANGLMFVGLEGVSPGAQIVDVRDPYNPVQLTNVTVRTAVHNLFYADGWLYLVDSSTNQIDIVDLRGYDPDNAPPTISSGTYRMTGVGNLFVHDITVQGGRLYAAAWNSLEVYDVTQLAVQAPTLLGSASGNSVHAAWATDDGQWVITTEERGGGGMTLFEVTDLGGSIDLAQRTTLTLPGSKAYSVHNVLIEGDTAYVSWYEAGVQVLQIDRDNGDLIPLASYDTTAISGDNGFFDGCWGVYPYLGSDKVLASDRQNGLFVLDVQPNVLFFDYPAGVPEVVDSDVAEPLEVTISAIGAPVDPTTPTLATAVNGVPQGDQSLMDLGGGLWGGQLPAASCGSIIEFSVSAENTQGALFTDPANGSAYRVDVANQLVTTFADTFDSDLGWLVQDIDVQSGSWERGNPIGTGSQPEDCFEGTNCYFTGQGVVGGGSGDEDVDGGPTILTSPSLDFSLGNGAVRYAYWMSNDDGDDSLIVELSADGGPWVEAKRYTGGGGGWIEDAIIVGDVLTPTADIRVRFSVADNPNDSVTEAALDSLRAEVFVCDELPLSLIASDLVRGQTATLTTTGAESGESVSFAVSGTGVGMGPCPPLLGGLCLDLLSPRLVGSAVANLDGMAQLTFNVPGGLAIDTAWFQSVIVRGPGGADSVKTNVAESDVVDP